MINDKLINLCSQKIVRSLPIITQDMRKIVEVIIMASRTCVWAFHELINAKMITTTCFVKLADITCF